jgi:ferredoxin--NADP+ reductase
MSSWVTAEVIQNIRWAENLHSLQVKTDLEPFVAGQFTRLALTIDGERIARPYSFVNPPHSSLAEFYFNVVQDGPLSTRLAALGRGDELEIAQPANGFFTLNEVPEGRHLWLFATGTALGPFLSILYTPQPWERFEKIILIHAVRTAVELTYQDIVTQFSQTHPDQFQFISFVSQEHHEGAMTGRIPAAIIDGRLTGLTALDLNPDDSQVMICGNLPMIRDTTEALQRLGLKKNRRSEAGQITTEKYW